MYIKKIVLDMHLYYFLSIKSIENNINAEYVNTLYLRCAT